MIFKKKKKKKIVVFFFFRGAGGGGVLGWGMGDGLGGAHCGMSGKCCFVKV